MIKSIEKLHNFGCFTNYTKESGLNQFAKVNILYGANGTGKSTLSNLLYCLSSKCPNKSQLLNEYIDESTELELETEVGKIKKNNVAASAEDIYVFNNNFVNEHIYNGTETNVASFDATIKLTNSAIESFDNRLKQLKLRETYLSTIKEALSAKHKSIWNKYKTEFSNRIVGPRLTNVQPKITDSSGEEYGTVAIELEKLYQDYKKKDEEASSLGKIKQIEIQLEDIPSLSKLVPEIEAIVKTNIKNISGERIKRNIELVSNEIASRKLTNKILSPSEWFRNAGRYLFFFNEKEQENCPLCNSDIKGKFNSLIEEFSSYYNNTTTKLLDDIQVKETILEDFNYDKIEKLFLLIIADLKHLDVEYIYQETIVPKNEVISDIKDLSELIRKKKKSLNETPTYSDQLASKLILYIKQIDERASAIIELVKNEKQIINSVKLSDILANLKAKVKTITILDFNLSTNTVLENSKKINFEIATQANKLSDIISDDCSLIEADRAVEIAKLDAESKFVNIYLAYLGIDHFTIKRENDGVDNITINYKTTGKIKKGLRSTLSEGEKTALAFSYYISKIRAEVLEGTEDGFKNKIFVIDDPISSLDENRLFQTANLIDTFFFHSFQEVEKYPNQMFFFSHNYNFAKYLNNNLKTNPKTRDNCQDYYLQKSEPQITSLPNGLKNYSNTYIIKLQEIINFKTKGEPEYHIAKNYIPNYIRIVLETFLGFKLATVKDNENYLPSLKHLLNKMVKELSQIDDYEISLNGNPFNKEMAIQRLNHLKRISDHESHGSISKLQEMSYIAESELKDFAKYTMQLIEYLDDIHIKKIKGLMQ